MIVIDGSHGEGGGQMLRTALVLSLATSKPFRMHSIRAGRDKPGLKAQHLHALRALGRMSDCGVSGAVLGSTEVEFHPAPVRPGSYEVDIGTAGSITLLLQSLLPAAFLSGGPCELSLTGGTDVRWSPPLDFLREIILPRIPGVTPELSRRGFYPAGGGRLTVRVAPGKFPRLALAGRGKLSRIRVLSAASSCLKDAQVAERQAAAAARPLRNLCREVLQRVEYRDSASPGSVVTAVAECEGGAVLAADALGERGKRAELVGREAARLLAQELESGAPVDRHAGDQLIPWLALGGGAITVSELTGHARTNVWVCERFLGPVLRVDGNTVSSSS